MQPQSEAFDAIVVGSGISGGWAAKELTEKACACCCSSAARTSSTSRTTSNARKAPWEYPHRGGRTQRDGRRLPGAQARLPAEREEPRLVGERAGLAVHRGQALRLVSRLSRRRPLADCGAGRATARATSTSRPTRGRASPSTGRSATPTSRRGTTTSSGSPASRARSKGCRSCPTASSSRRCRSTAARQLVAGRLAKSVRRPRPDHPGRVANLTQPLRPRGRCQYPQRLLRSAAPTAPTSARSRRRCRRPMATGRLTLKTVLDRDRA